MINLRFILKFLLGTMLVLPASVFACVDKVLSNQSFNIEGSATTPDGELIYSEFLTRVPDETGGTLKVDYKDPSGALIAHKTVKYNCNLTTPSFILEDKSASTSEGVRWNEDHLESFQGEEITRIEHPTGPAVVDAGFDNVIKLNWDKLLRGDSVKYDYLFARRNKFLKLRFSRSNPPKFLQGKVDDSVAFFKVGASNMIFRMLSSPIYVGYDVQSKALAYYYGPTNLPMVDMETPLLITYRNG